MDTKQYNKYLIEKYSFLLPRNVKTDAVVDNFDYSFCLLKDEIPKGWWKFFGESLCDDLKDILIRNGLLDTFRFVECKEKFGQIRLYDNGHPEEWAEHLWAWEYISEHTCCICGTFPVPMRNDGWMCPYCDNCFSEYSYAVKKGISMEQLTCNKEFSNRAQEYTGYYTYSKEGKELHLIDLKPFYQKLGFPLDDLIPVQLLEDDK